MYRRKIFDSFSIIQTQTHVTPREKINKTKY